MLQSGLFIDSFSMMCRRQRQQTEVAQQPQQPITLSDFQTALQTYKPTAVQAEQFQQPNIDPMSAITSFLHHYSQQPNDEIPAYTPPNGTTSGDAGSSPAGNQDGAESI